MNTFSYEQQRNLVAASEAASKALFECRTLSGNVLVPSSEAFASVIPPRRIRVNLDSAINAIGVALKFIILLPFAPLMDD